MNEKNICEEMWIKNILAVSQYVMGLELFFSLSQLQF